MKFKTVSAEELEIMPFDDIAYIILKEKGKKMKIMDIFKIICDTFNPLRSFIIRYKIV